MYYYIVMNELSDFEKDGSVLAWTRAQDPERRVEFVAIERLTDAPVEVRTRFIDELSAEYAALDDPEIAANPRTAIIKNIGYIAGYYEPVEYRQRVYTAWQEAEPTLEHPVFHDLLMAHDTAKIAKNN